MFTLCGKEQHEHSAKLFVFHNRFVTTCGWEILFSFLVDLLL